MPVGSVSQSLAPGDTFSDEDVTTSFGDVSLGTTARLLLRLEITAATPVPPLGRRPVHDPSLRLELAFFDSEFEAVYFESTPGTVTIAALAAVPEPTSMGLFCLGVLGLVALGRRSVRGSLIAEFRLENRERRKQRHAIQQRTVVALRFRSFNANGSTSELPVILSDDNGNHRPLDRRKTWLDVRKGSQIVLRYPAARPRFAVSIRSSNGSSDGPWNAGDRLRARLDREWGRPRPDR